MTPVHQGQEDEPAPSSIGRPKGRVDGVATAVLAVGMGIALALVVDLAGPKRDEGKLATTAPSTMPASDLAARMDAQIAAGAPGVALALEDAAKPAGRKASSTSILP